MPRPLHSEFKPLTIYLLFFITFLSSPRSNSQMPRKQEPQSAAVVIGCWNYFVWGIYFFSVLQALRLLFFSLKRTHSFVHGKACNSCFCLFLNIRLGHFVFKHCLTLLHLPFPKHWHELSSTAWKPCCVLLSLHTEALKSLWPFCGTLINDCHSFKEWMMLFLSLFFFFLASTPSFRSHEFSTLAGQKSFLWQTNLIPVINYKTWHHWRAADALRAVRSFGEPALMLAIRYTWCSQGLLVLKAGQSTCGFPMKVGTGRTCNKCWSPNVGLDAPSVE